MILITLDNLKLYTQKIKELLATKTALSETTQKADDAIKSCDVVGKQIMLYRSADKTGEPDFVLDFPIEYFLDQTETNFVQSFVWSEEAYPNTENPNLDGRPVMVLAVKGSGDTPSFSYSFIDLTYLLNTYVGKPDDGSATVTVDGYNIKTHVNLSGYENNCLIKRFDGLYIDVTNKVTKALLAEEGHLAQFTSDGDLADSGLSIETAVDSDVAFLLG